MPYTNAINKPQHVKVLKNAVRMICNKWLYTFPNAGCDKHAVCQQEQQRFPKRAQKSAQDKPKII